MKTHLHKHLTTLLCVLLLIYWTIYCAGSTKMVHALTRYSNCTRRSHQKFGQTTKKKTQHGKQQQGTISRIRYNSTAARNRYTPSSGAKKQTDTKNSASSLTKKPHHGHKPHKRHTQRSCTIDATVSRLNDVGRHLEVEKEAELSGNFPSPGEDDQSLPVAP